jgi:hypothetical protein
LAPQDADADPLLALILDGAKLSVVQFLADLRAQRMGNRREARIDVSVPVLLTGSDISGRPLDQRVMTINVSKRGAVLQGIYGLLRVGDRVSLSRGQRKEQFSVQWVGEENSARAAQIAVAAVDSETSFWDEVIDAEAGSGGRTSRV